MLICEPLVDLLKFNAESTIINSQNATAGFDNCVWVAQLYFLSHYATVAFSVVTEAFFVVKLIKGQGGALVDANLFDVLFNAAV